MNDAWTRAKRVFQLPQRSPWLSSGLLSDERSRTLARLTVNYDHLSSNYGQAPVGFGLRCFALFPLHWLCVQVLSQQVTPLLLIDYVDWLLGYLFSTDTLFVDKRSQSVYLTSGQMCGTCEALCSMCA